MSHKFRILQCDRVDGGIAITFGDGCTCLFTPDLLRAHLEEAEEITEKVP
ncbi:hypothetical protein [Granulicella sibirica]|nr:hypothetical protein [Granulicella sibirica]